MRFNSIIHWFFGLEEDQEQIIDKQKRHRHRLHEQIRNTNNIEKILKPRLPSSIPIPVRLKKKRKSQINITCPNDPTD